MRSDPYQGGGLVRFAAAGRARSRRPHRPAWTALPCRPGVTFRDRGPAKNTWRVKIASASIAYRSDRAAGDPVPKQPAQGLLARHDEATVAQMAQLHGRRETWVAGVICADGHLGLRAAGWRRHCLREADQHIRCWLRQSAVATWR